jgi:hypothetical protein
LLRTGTALQHLSSRSFFRIVESEEVQLVDTSFRNSQPASATRVHFGNDGETRTRPPERSRLVWLLSATATFALPPEPKSAGSCQKLRGGRFHWRRRSGGLQQEKLRTKPEVCSSSAGGRLQAMFLRQSGKALSLRDGEFEHHLHSAVFADTDIWRIVCRKKVPRGMLYHENLSSERRRKIGDLVRDTKLNCFLSREPHVVVIELRPSL